jgi:uncharacterized membrane protein YkoI
MSLRLPIRAAALSLGLLCLPSIEVPLQAADAQCLTHAQRRTVSASGKVVPLSKAIRAARARKVDVVDARLCKGPKGLVYVLTLLAHDGKVTRATIDAASGTLSDGG